MAGFGNRMAMAVLRSPLHRVMSGSLMVMSYEGRRSGRRYELPLQYVGSGDELAVLAGKARDKTWWRNFTDAAQVDVVIRGSTVGGKAHVVADHAERTELLTRYLDRFPATTPAGRPRFFGSRWRPTPEEIAEAASSMVFVVVELEAAIS